MKGVAVSNFRVGVMTGLFCLALFSSTVFANLIEKNPLLKIPVPEREYAGQLETLAKRQGIAADFFKLKLAEKHLNNKNPGASLKLLSGVNSSIYTKWRALVQAEALLAQDKPLEALRSLPKLPTIPKPELSFGETFYKNLCIRVFWTKYSAKKRLGTNTSNELAWLTVLLVQDRAFQDFMKSQPAPSLTLEQKFTKLHHLYFSYQYKQIPGILSADDILSASMPQDLVCQGLYELGDGLRAAGGRAAEALSVFQVLAKQNCPDEYAAKGLYRLGTLSLALKNTATARQALLKLNHKFSSHRLADDALYLLARHFEKFGQISEAKKYTELLLQSPGDMREEYLYEQGYPLFKKGQFKNASRIFAKVHDVGASPGESYPRNIYWHARSLEKSGETKNKLKARDVYRALVRDHPFSFYAVLASNRAGIKHTTQKLPILTGDTPKTGLEYFDAAAALNNDGFHSAARSMLDLALHTHPEWEKDYPQYVARMLMESQNYRKALDMAANHFNSGVYGPTQGSTDPMFAALYPLAYRQQTGKGYALTHLPRGAIEGIMREESLFQYNAKSWVGATGLMQLMPTTAKMVGRKLNEHAILDDLTDAQSNILLGSSYLRDMINYFNQQLPLAIMAYNAGPGNVNKWLRSNGHMELDEFIEDIPFTETRGYVKRVLRSMQVYGSFYGEDFFMKPSLAFAIKTAKK